MNNRNVHIDIGINGCFMARRWEQPKNWIEITRQTGFEYLEFDSDCLDPFFSGDTEYQRQTAATVRQLANDVGMIITDYYTGAATHRFHGLAHSNERVRERMKKWMVEAMDIAIELGANKIGGHFDAFSVEVLADKDLYGRQLDILYKTLKDIAVIGAEKGMEAIYLEQMYTPSEIPWTLDQTDEYLIELNSANKGCPIYLTVDTGHAAGKSYNLTGDSLLYEEWLKRFAAACEVIHLQQTTRDSSSHWPFTEEYNKKGDIVFDKILECIQWSHENYHRFAWSEVMKPADQNILVLEVIPSSTVEESQLIDQLTESCEYMRSSVPRGGMTISV